MLSSLALLLAAATLVSGEAAQFDSGQLSGFVRDAQQAALPGATVTVTNEATGNKRTTVTNGTGYYVLPDVPPGSYAVSVELSGFKKFVKTGIRLTAANQIAVDADLELGSIEETVLVTAGTPFVLTTTAGGGGGNETETKQEATPHRRHHNFFSSAHHGRRGG